MGALLWLRTFLLLSFLSALLVLLGYLLGGIYFAYFMFLLSIAINFISYWFSDTIVLRSYGARIIDEDEFPWLHEMVANLSRRAGIPKPRIAIVPISTPNAFATGRDPDHAVVAVTEGILHLLDEDELEAVLGHEITHIKNRDMLIGTIAAVIAAAIVNLAYWARWIAVLLFSGDDRDSSSLLALIILAIVAPLAALLIQMAISRTREYLADEGGAILSGKPEALARALVKLEHEVAYNPLPSEKASSAHLFIVNPIPLGFIRSLFSTHPPTEKRIENLRIIARKMGRYF